MQTQTKGSVGGVIVLVLVILFMIGAISSCFGGSDHTSKSSIVDAVQTQIKKGLYNPSDASFSSYDETTMTKNSDGTYEVEGYIDDTNGFGAKMRNNYRAEVTVEDNGYSISYQLQNAVTGEWQ
jgi:hypothetical protein